MGKENAIPWYGDDDMWTTFEPMMFNEERLSSTPEEVTKICELLQIQTEDEILDLCCGVGRHSLELTRRGYRVVGVDRTEPYLRRAKTMAKDEGLDIEFVKEDMRNFIREDSFDVVLSLFTSFGYFEEHEDQMHVLRNIFASLRVGGRFIFQSMGKEVLASIFHPKGWTQFEDGFRLEERRPTHDWSKMHNVWHFIGNDGTIKTWDVDHWIYSAEEFKQMLRSVGFSETLVFGNFDGSPYDNNARYIVVVGIKK